MHILLRVPGSGFKIITFLWISIFVYGVIYIFSFSNGYTTPRFVTKFEEMRLTDLPNSHSFSVQNIVKILTNNTLTRVLDYASSPDQHEYQNESKNNTENILVSNEKQTRDVCADLSKISFPDSVQKYNCTRLFSGNRTEQLNAMKYRRVTHSSDEYHYQKVTRNCSEYVQNKGYITAPLNEEEAKFPLAFSILMFRDPEQVERLLRTIYRPQNYYCIHVDQQFDAVYKAMENIIKCLPNVFMSGRRFKVIWGGYSVLQPEIQCMTQLLSYKWRYFINLTGMELPLRTNWELVQIFKTLKGANLIHASFKEILPHRIGFRWKDNKKIGLMTQEPPFGIRVAKGFAYNSLTWDFVDFAINSEVGKQFLHWVSETKSPEETFFATLNMNPNLGVPGAYTGPENLAQAIPELNRFVRWAFRPCPGNTTQRNWSCVIGVELLPEAVQNKKLFANKFLYDPDQVLAFDCMEEMIINRIRQEYCEGRLVDTELLRYYGNSNYVKWHSVSPSLMEFS